MKKATSIFGKLSLATVVLFTAITSSIAQPASKSTLAGSDPSASKSTTCIADQKTAEWNLFFNNDRQKLFVKQAGDDIQPVNVIITDLKGYIVYNRMLSGGINNIDISGIPTGKYVVNLQSNSAKEEYKLLIL
jgi:hypothetical protein